MEFLPRYQVLCRDRGARRRPEILLVQHHVRDHLAEDMGVETAAELVNMSKSYFSHLFKKETGMSFIDYVNRARIDRARELLQGTTKRISEVAEDVGIRNPNYFCVLFKKLTGSSPGEFRVDSSSPKEESEYKKAGL